jgi:pilus assembly protein CpaE
MADLIARRDIDQMLEVLRRSYQAIVIDTASALGDATLAFLDAADLVLGVVTPEPAAADAMRAMTETFAVMGFRDAKVQLVVNDRDRPGAVSVRELAAMVGREPAFSVASDGAVVAESNARGAPFVLARPDAPVSADVRRMAASVRAMVVTNDAGVQNPRVAWRH